MRSLLFVPADSSRKLERALRSGADALILDLEDSVAVEQKAAARRSALAFLQANRDAAERPLLYIRINALDTGLSESDLDIVMTGAPDGIVLPKAAGGEDIALLDSRLAVREALHGLSDGGTKIIAIATESARALFRFSSYAGAGPRLAGLAWGGEDLSADVGSLSTREEGVWSEPFRLARNFCLFGAASAGVAAIDTVFTDLRDLDGLRLESEEAARDGFSGKLAIHPDQVAVINEAFSPSDAAIARAERIVAAFAEAAGAGVIALDGKMLDRPHLTAAERLLARRRTSPPRSEPNAS